jgi:DNA repair exonuclease SbcCD nuclease subunit
MKLLFFTDSHIRGTNPRSRIDDSYTALKNKFKEIAQIITEQDIDYVLHGGDWFDRPDISPSIVRDFAILIKSFNRPIYTIAGNHDIYGHNPNTLSRTMLGLLEGTNTINVLDAGENIFLEKDKVKVQIIGNPYHFDIDGEGSRDSYVVKKDASADYCINMVHGFLLPKPFIEGAKYTLIDDILETQADITLVGHYHSGFGIIERNHKYFINPGSVFRISASKAELLRIPGVVVITLEKDIGIKFEQLCTALPSEQVLNRDHIENAQKLSYKLYEFFNNIYSIQGFEQSKIDINKMIEEISTTQGLKSEIKLETIRRIEDARLSLKNEGDEG